MASWLPEVSLGIGPGQVVHGSGSFGWEPYGNYHGVDLTNHGIIQATNTVNQFDILATTVANLNLVEATGGGLLRIWGAWDNTAGEIHAGDGSVVRLSFEADHPARIEGGVLRTSGTGEIQTTGGVSLEDITLEGTLHLQRYTDIHMADIITNNGFIKQGVDGWAGSAVVYVDSALTFAGDGLLRMGDANVIKMFQWPDHNALVTNGPQHTIESHGGFFGELPNYYGDQRIELLNEGTIICEDATYNTEFRCTGAGFENRGTLEIQPAADTSTRVWGPFLQTSGRLEWDDALVAMDSGLAFTGGVLAGQGSLQGSVAVGGECVIHPGDEGEIGTLDIWGPLTVNHGATLVCEWAHNQKDRLAVHGLLSATGNVRLRVEYLEIEPSRAADYTVLTCDERDDQATWTVELPDGWSYDSLAWEGNDLVVHGMLGMPSDAPELPVATALHGVAPNPFNPTTTLSFSLAQDGPVRLWVADVRGRRMRMLVDGRQAAGEHQVRWNGRDDAGRGMGSGTYLGILETRDGRRTRRMTLVR